MRTDFDVVVVGAGPSGTAAAHRLRKSDYRVLLVDRSQFPRVKPCGGGISIKALKLMPWSIAPVLQRAVKELGMGVKTEVGEKFEVFSSDQHVCTFAVREEFDRLNFERTLDAGVEFERTSELSSLTESKSFVEVGFGDRKITTRFLIGADGANSTVRRLLKAGSYFYRGFALEGLVDYAHLGPEPPAEFFFGYATNGYGWLFPKRDHINVGIYTWDDQVSLSKEQLRSYALDRLGTDRIENIVGFPLGFGGRNYAPNRDRVLLVGDAAGFAEPLLGEGIHNALKSGQAAASAILAFDRGAEESLRKCYKAELSPIYNDLTRCEEMKHFFYENLAGIGYGALRLPLSKTALMRGFAAGMTMYELTNRFYLSPFFQAVYPTSLREFLDHAPKGNARERIVVS